MLKDNILDLQHIAIPTNDIKQTTDFYQLLGFEVILETYNENANEKVAFLKLNSLVIETYENHCAKMNTGSIDHIALTVKNIDETFVNAKKLNLVLLHDSPIYLPFWENGLKFFMIEGINKEKIEFSQYL